MTVTLLHAYPFEFDGRSVMLRDALAAEGVEVVLAHVDHTGCRTFAEWADRFADHIVDEHQTDEPMRLLGYCIGGVMCVEVAARLTARGRPPAYVGLVEAWSPSPLTRLVDGTYRHYRVPWRNRIRGALFELSRPHGPRARTIAAAWTMALLKWPPRWFRDVVIRRGAPRRRKSRWEPLRLAWALDRSSLDIPVFAYHTAHSTALMNGDRTLGLSPHLRGGFVLRTVGGDHAACTDHPHLEDLARVISVDLDLVEAGRP